MVHARAFSFTDDATNVGWPRPSSFSRRASITGQMLSGSEPAFLLFQLRRAQSHWYQRLFQSEPTPLQDSSSFIWQMCQEMKEWAEALPSTLPAGMRALFDLEVRYSFDGPLSLDDAPTKKMSRRESSVDVDLAGY